MPNPRALWWKSTKLSPSFFQSLTPNCFEVSNIWIQYSAQLQPTLRERELIMAEQPVCVNQLTYISNNALSLTWFWQDNGKKLLDFLWWKQNESRLEILARELIIIRILFANSEDFIKSNFQMRDCSSLYFTKTSNSKSKKVPRKHPQQISTRWKYCLSECQTWQSLPN